MPISARRSLRWTVISILAHCSTLYSPARAMYDRDLWNRWQGINSGFGVCSQPRSSDGEDAVGLEDGGVSRGEARAVDGNADD
ncbi:hypothetical protein OG21DRAFT_1510629 [Imleria badia]|nr:hypothetical protein OG21DRAFT_1510629 [Imleria badia]